MKICQALLLLLLLLLVVVVVLTLTSMLFHLSCDNKETEIKKINKKMKQ